LFSVVAIIDEVLRPCVIDGEVSESAALVVVIFALDTDIEVTFSVLVLLVVVVLISIATVVISEGVVSVFIAVDATSVTIAATDVVATTAAAAAAAAAAAVLDRATVVMDAKVEPVVVATVDGIVVVVAETLPGEDATRVEVSSETDTRKEQHDDDSHTEDILRT
jgi:hypothetical protein